MAAAAPYRSSSLFSIIGLSILLVLFLYCSSWSVVDGLGGKVGGMTEIKDVKTNKEVQELGRFSVQVYNKNQHGQHHHQVSGNSGGGGGSDLLFSKVVKAQTQVVSGVKYFLKISASQNGVAKSFDAIVVVKPWMQSKQLLNFSPTTN